jgi:hypothetical protein
MTLLCVGTAAAQDNNRQQKPIVLLDYLTVYPYDIGGFSEYPENVIEAINKKNMFGYNDWRVPTTEEYELIYASRNEVRGLKDFEGYCWYINKDGKYQQNYKGRLRLVTTSTKKVEIED